jgi:demethylmenaquinone methyltransferase/2-methoxy-6-polyprenyl-1,4-benzoquinol methylase
MKPLAALLFRGLSAIFRAMSAYEPQQNDTTTHFGFRTVKTTEKQGLVRDVFDSVADKYDLMNDLMSGGLHRVWKARMVDALHIGPTRQIRLVDVAGGTGDIAFRACRRAARLGSQMRAQVIDANAEMVRVGRDRSEDLKENSKDASLSEQVDFLTGTAESLPLPDASADMVSIAFGIRNVTHRDKALSDMHRVLKPGGRFVCLEFSHMPSRLLQKAYDAYSFTFIPPMGKWVTGDSESYQYLVESIRQFPAAAAFEEEVRAAGFARVQHQLLSGGVAALHMGWKL